MRFSFDLVFDFIVLINILISLSNLLLKFKVISPDLILEVEARMNRNYLPPSLKNASQISGSPPTNSYIMQQQRRYGRACKLPTVQEVMSKLICSCAMVVRVF